MKRSVLASAASALALCGIFGCLPATLAFAQVSQIDLVSGAGGSRSVANGTSEEPVISADGTKILFASTAEDLDPGRDGNGSKDVFLFDRITRSVRLVSRDPLGNHGSESGTPDGICRVTALDDGGVHLAFQSNTDNFNLAVADTNGRSDVFYVNDQGSIIKASSGPGLTDSNGDSAHPAIAISPDNRGFLAFDSDGDDILPPGQDTNGRVRDVFIFDVTTFQSELVSVDSGGAQSTTFDSRCPTISSNGQLVAFLSQGALVTGVRTDLFQVYLRDRAGGGSTTLLSGLGGAGADGDNTAPQISANGNVVVFGSAATNLDPACSNGRFQIYRVDLSATNPRPVCISRNQQGLPGDGHSGLNGQLGVSADGRFITYATEAINLVPGITPVAAGIMLYDTANDTTTVVSRTDKGVDADARSYSPAISGDGGIVAFWSEGGNLINGDDNGQGDVFFVVPAEKPGVLTPNTTIDFPPGVTIVDNDATVLMQKFTRVKTKSAAQSEPNTAAAKKPGTKPSIRYNVTVTNQSSGQSRRVTSKRNVATFSNLPPGSYTATYRVSIVKGKKRVSSTNTSPAAPFTIQ